MPSESQQIYYGQKDTYLRVAARQNKADQNEPNTLVFKGDSRNDNSVAWETTQ